MVKSLGTALIALGVAGFCSNGYAADLYAGANVGFIDIGGDEGGDASLTTLYGRGGASFAENFSVEARLGLGVGDDSIGGVDVSLKYLMGLYLRAGVPLSEQFFPYAVLGYSKIEAEAEIGNASSSNSESDLSYGFGVDFRLNETITINGEYMNYVDKEFELSGFAIGASMAF